MQEFPILDTTPKHALIIQFEARRFTVPDLLIIFYRQMDPLAAEHHGL
jgi:peptide methionine sulfoxide reductase MsrA